MSKSIPMLRLFRERNLSCSLLPGFRKLCSSGFNFRNSGTSVPEINTGFTVNATKSFLFSDNIPTFSQYTCIRKYAKGAIVKDKKGKSGKPKVQLSDEELRSVFNPDSMNRQMQTVIDRLLSDYVKHMSVRSTGGIEKLPIMIEDEEFPLNEVAQLFRKSPELIVVNMTNFPEGIKAVLDALAKSGMNASTQQDGTMIYVTFPKVTREHRQKLAASAKARFNKARDDIKEVQNKFVKDVKKPKDSVSEDLVYNVTEHIRYTCENYVQDAEKVFRTKEKELLGE